MSSFLIVSASSEGQTTKIAERLAQRLETAGAEVHQVDANAPELDAIQLRDYDAVLVGSSVHTGSHAPAILEFVRAHLQELEEMPSGFFSVSLSAAGTSEEDRHAVDGLLEQFVERTGWHPSTMQAFAGALMYSKYNVFIRFVLRRIAGKKSGDTDTSRDYEYTDWDGVDHFADAFFDLAQSGDQHPVGIVG